MKNKNNLEEQTYNFSRDVLNFIMTLRRKSIDNKLTKSLKQYAGRLGISYIESLETSNETEKLEKIAHCRQYAEQTLDCLNKLDCGDDYLIDEKLDLMINAAGMVKSLDSLIEGDAQ